MSKANCRPPAAIGSSPTASRAAAENQVFSSGFSSLGAMVPIVLKRILAFGCWPDGFARGFRQHPDLRARWLDQNQVVIFEFLFQVFLTAQLIQSGRKTLIQALRFAQALFTPLFQQPKLRDLVLLPDIPHGRTADQQANKKCLQRRSKPERRRLIFSISRHKLFNSLRHSMHSPCLERAF